MLRSLFLLSSLVVACFAVPGERPRRYYHDVGLGGYGGEGGGGGYGGYQPHGGAGYPVQAVPHGAQSYSKSSASSSSVSTGGSFGRK